MKKIFLAAGVMMVATATFAQSIVHETRKEARIENKEARKDLREERRLENRNEVSVLTKDQFGVDFPDAKDVRFGKEESFDVASFVSGNNEKLKAYYDYSSKLVGTTERKSFADLPENAQKKIQKEYAGYNTTAVIKFNDNMDNDMDMILYGVSFDDADNYFAELKKDNKAIVVKVDLSGDVTYFTAIK